VNPLGHVIDCVADGVGAGAVVAVDCTGPACHGNSPAYVATPFSGRHTQTAPGLADGVRRRDLYPDVCAPDTRPKVQPRRFGIRDTCPLEHLLLDLTVTPTVT